mmetsp:Transcript_13156/g.31221  ORF Transcript_13156/g.31221 Transcript_13156/m.31221 type:complete len:98 (+) Transcript_13156:1127-1420(+)
MLFDGMGCEEGENNLAYILLEQFTDRIEVSAEDPVAVTAGHIERIQESYDGIGSFIHDEEFKTCGLVQAHSVRMGRNMNICIQMRILYLKSLDRDAW